MIITLCCSMRAMSWDSFTDMSSGSMISSSTCTVSRLQQATVSRLQSAGYSQQTSAGYSQQATVSRLQSTCFSSKAVQLRPAPPNYMGIALSIEHADKRMYTGTLLMTDMYACIVCDLWRLLSLSEIAAGRLLPCIMYPFIYFLTVWGVRYSTKDNVPHFLTMTH